MFCEMKPRIVALFFFDVFPMFSSCRKFRMARMHKLTDLVELLTTHYTPFLVL